MKLTHPENFNIELASTVLRHLTEHPEQHVQAVLMNGCGTAGCVAGWTCYFGGVYSYQMDRAQVLLGLTPFETVDLFSGGISESSARRMLAQFIDQATLYQEAQEERRQSTLDAQAREQVRRAQRILAFSRIKKISRMCDSPD